MIATVSSSRRSSSARAGACALPPRCAISISPAEWKSAISLTHAALTYGKIDPEKPTLMRVHRANLLSDAFGFALSSGRKHLAAAMAAIAKEGSGVIIYLDVDRDAAELSAALQQYVSRGEGQPWPPPDSGNQTSKFREFGLGAQILVDLGVRQLRVMTNHPRRLRGVAGYGLEVVEWLPIPEDDAPTAERGIP